MHSLDPTDYFQHDVFAADQLAPGSEHSGWNDTSLDGFSGTDFSHADSQLVDVQHSSLDSIISHTSTVDLIAPGYDLHSEVNMAEPSHMTDHNFAHNLSTTVFYPESIGTTANDHFSAMPRSGTSPDYAAAESNEGWAKHKEEIAESWANSGYYDMASSLQKDADYYHDKAVENLNT